MAETTSSTGVQKDQVTMIDVWNRIRGLENTLRYYGDVWNGWMTYGGLDARSAIRGNPVSYGPIPLPPPCDPPWCPWRDPDIVKSIREVAARVNEIADTFEHVQRQINIKEGQDIYISEVPGTHWPERNGR